MIKELILQNSKLYSKAYMPMSEITLMMNCRQENKKKNIVVHQLNWVQLMYSI